MNIYLWDTAFFSFGHLTVFSSFSCVFSKITFLCIVWIAQRPHTPPHWRLWLIRIVLFYYNYYCRAGKSSPWPCSGPWLGLKINLTKINRREAYKCIYINFTWHRKWRPKETSVFMLVLMMSRQSWRNRIGQRVRPKGSKLKDT